MFQRRVQWTALRKAREVIWPSMGYRRAIVYLWHRLQRIPGTSASIAAGFACGVGAAMTPFYGTHIVTAMVLALAIRGSVLAAAIGAQVANPWTAPFLWYAVYYIGAWFIGIETHSHPPNFVHMFKGLTESLLQLDGKLFFDSVWPVFWPMTLGSLPLGLVTGVGSYFILEPIIARLRHERTERIKGTGAKP
jgi:uncharacterized protein (DUF2062 family)